MNTRRKIGAITAAGLLAVSISAPAQAMDGMVKPAASLTVTAAAENTVRVSSVKGNTLNPGDRSFLMIEPYGGEYTAKSDNPAVVDAEQIMGFWVAVAKADGKASITVTNQAGASAAVEIAVGTGAEHAPEPDANKETRQECSCTVKYHKKIMSN